ncbi:9151_t:CDS:1, partial [Racocetra fulgida]
NQHNESETIEIKEGYVNRFEENMRTIAENDSEANSFGEDGFDDLE